MPPEDWDVDTLEVALGKAITIRRTELGLKRNDLRDRSGLSYPYIAELENGAKRASSKALAALASALELSVSELVARAEALRGSGSSLPSSWTTRPVAAPSVPPTTPNQPEQVARSATTTAAARPAMAPPSQRRRSWFHADEAEWPPSDLGAHDDEPLTEERVREIVRDELAALGVLPPKAAKSRRRT